MKPEEYLVQTSRESVSVREAFLKEYSERLIQSSRLMGECVQKGGKILIFGNGGSAADAQHMAAEMVGRMLMDRRPLPAIALTTDTSNLTALGNDFGFDQIFSRQIRALARPEDVVIGISTSGKSRNVLEGLKEARAIGCQVIGLSGGQASVMEPLCDIYLSASQGTNSSRIQETHIFAIHSMVDLMDRFFIGGQMQ